MKALLLLSRVVLLACLLGSSLLAQASHFRFGSITYQTNGATNRDVTFRVTEAWRDDAFTSTPPVLGQVVSYTSYLNFGDGNSVPVNITVTTVGPGYFYGEAIISHTYATAGTFTARVDDCCRISTLQNNADGDFYFSTPVAAGNANDSPVSTLLPIVNLPANQAGASYTIPATDPNGNALTYSVATAADLGGITFTNAPGLAVNPTTGQVTFSTVGKAVGQLYNAVIKVSDGATSIILDHIIQISNAAAANTAPAFTAPTPANGTVYAATVGQPLSFTVRATDADAGDLVTLQALGQPAGATTTPALPTTANPVQAVFAFTPTAAQVGSYVVSFVAQDKAGTQTTTSVTINVQLSVCNAVGSLLATALTSTSATLTFAAGSGATAYVVTYTPGGGGPAQTVTATTSPVALAGLLPGTAYTATVASQCGGGLTATASVAFTTLPAPTVPTVGDVSVLYQTGDLGQPTDNALRPFLQLVNNGSVDVPYQSLTVRYWLTVENFAPLVTPVDWAKAGTSLVSARYVMLATPRQGAFGYIEYSFAAGAGSLLAGTSSGPIYGKAYKQSWTDFDETDDWSYQTSGSFTANDHLTVYQNGALIGGTEPPAVAATTSLKVYAANQDSSPTTSYLSVALQVGNVGTVPVSYGDLTVRYWLTPDGTQPLVYSVDFAKLGSQNVSLQAGQQGTEAYTELRFAASLGTFYPQSNTDNIQFRIRKSDYSLFTQANDYSFGGSAALAEQPRITAYLGGQLVYGTEPAGATAATQRSVAATAADAAAAPAPPGEPLAVRLTGSPNPFTDELRLEFSLAYTQAYTLGVYDGQGRLVRALPGGTAPAGQPQRLTLPAQELAAGLYLVRLTTDTDRQQLKFIKQ